MVSPLYRSIIDAISIHAPARGATTHQEPSIKGKLYFNPRTREGCDFIISADGNQGIDFNPRTREGCDMDWVNAKIQVGNFNPRTREGCDRSNKMNIVILSDFNPRTREGCDKTLSYFTATNN